MRRPIIWTAIDAAIAVGMVALAVWYPEPPTHLSFLAGALFSAAIYDTLAEWRSYHLKVRLERLKAETDDASVSP